MPQDRKGGNTQRSVTFSQLPDTDGRSPKVAPQASMASQPSFVSQKSLVSASRQNMGSPDHKSSALKRNPSNLGLSLLRGRKKQMTVSEIRYVQPSSIALSYEGDQLLGRPHGFGVEKLDNGIVYMGMFTEGVWHERGELFYPDGTKYKGDFDRGVAHGFGVALYTDRGKFMGQFKDGIVHGRGIRIFSGGAVFRGSFEEGKRKGAGILIWGDKGYRCRYEGEFEDDIVKGMGVLTFTNADCWGKDMGNFERGALHGFGVRRFFGGLSSGDRYQGRFIDGKQDGPGVYIWENGDVYQGFFKANEMEEFGVLKFANGNMYQGQFLMGKQHGLGRYTWKNGDSYFGTFEANKISGRGVFTYSTGDTYAGQCERGRPHGLGVYVFANSDEYGGEMAYGSVTGKGVYAHNSKRQRMPGGEIVIHKDEGHFVDGKVVDRVPPEMSRLHHKNLPYSEAHQCQRNGKGFSERSRVLEKRCDDIIRDGQKKIKNSAIPNKIKMVQVQSASIAERARFQDAEAKKAAEEALRAARGGTDERPLDMSYVQELDLTQYLDL